MKDINIVFARGFWQRLRGLIGKTTQPGEVLVIPRCPAIHTFFLTQPITVAFLDTRGKVVKVVRDLKPWRFAFSEFGYYAVEWSSSNGFYEQFKLGSKVEIPK